MFLPQSLYTFYFSFLECSFPRLRIRMNTDGFFYHSNFCLNVIFFRKHSLTTLFKVELLPPVTFFHIIVFIVLIIYIVYKIHRIYIIYHNSFIILKMSFHYLVYLPLYHWFLRQKPEGKMSSIFFTIVSVKYDMVPGMY